MDRGVNLEAELCCRWSSCWVVGVIGAVERERGAVRVREPFHVEQAQPQPLEESMKSAIYGPRIVSFILRNGGIPPPSSNTLIIIAHTILLDFTPSSASSLRTRRFTRRSTGSKPHSRQGCISRLPSLKSPAISRIAHSYGDEDLIKYHQDQALAPIPHHSFHILLSLTLSGRSHRGPARFQTLRLLIHVHHTETHPLHASSPPLAAPITNSPTSKPSSSSEKRPNAENVGYLPARWKTVLDITNVEFLRLLDRNGVDSVVS